MKHLITFILLLVCINTFAQRYKKIHFRSVLIDTHNDIPSTAIEKGVSFDQDTRTKTHSDLNRMLQGGVDAQLFSIWCDGNKINPYQWANREMDTVLAWTSRNPDKMMLALTANDMMKAARQKKLGVAFGVEGGHMIENDLNKLEALYKKGARYMTLTWNNSTDWATSAQDETTKGDSLKHKGLTDFGKTVVHKMNELGMLVDLSHVGEQTFWDAIHTSTKPVLVSHSCVYQLNPVPRNLNDEQIKAVGKNGGLISLNFYSGFLDSTYNNKQKQFFAKHSVELKALSEKYGRSKAIDTLIAKHQKDADATRPSIEVLIDHVDYIVKMIGVDHVSFGADFDGAESFPLGINSVADYPKITAALLKRGYNSSDITKMLGGNFIRVLKANKGG